MAWKPQILFVLSSCDKFENGKPTGWYLSEFAHPYEVLKDTFSITVASPSGGAAPLDPSSIDAAKDDSVSVNFHKTQSALWSDTAKLSDLTGRGSEFAAVFYVGGHGPMFDLASSDVNAELILEFAHAGKVVSAVCHGPAVLCHEKLKDYVKDEEVTGFSNSEEEAVGLTDAVPFALETRLKEHGAKYSKGADWGEHVVVAKKGKLITGQNPGSAKGVAEKVKDAVIKK